MALKKSSGWDGRSIAPGTLTDSDPRFQKVYDPERGGHYSAPAREEHQEQENDQQ